MHRFIIAVYIGLCCIDTEAQDWPVFAEQMERRMYEAPNDRARNAILLSKLDSAFHCEDLLAIREDVSRDLKRLNWDELSPVERNTAHWNGALLAYSAGEYNEARIHITKYQRLASDTSIHAQFLQMLIAIESDSLLAGKLSTQLVGVDTGFVALNTILQKRWSKEQRSLPYVLVGALIPGSGLMAEGFVGKGLTALMLNSATGLALAAMIKANLYFNIATWGVMLVQKFYIGQLNLTSNLFRSRHPRKLAQQHEALNKELLLLLTKYPLQYKTS
jgi:hypothetical protein